MIESNHILDSPTSTVTSTSSRSDSPQPSSTSSSSKRPPSVVVETLGAITSETKEGLRKINNYLLKQEIGRGAFGTVHLGIDTTTQTEYAIKEFSKSRLRRKEQSEMLRRRGGPRGRGRGLGVGREAVPASSNPLDLVRGEVAILKKLHHINVVKLFEVLDDPNDDSIYMVFEMAHKGVLMSISMDETATPYSEEQARHYFREMILGIEYLHNNDIAHRDIKPDNLLISNDDILKIVDFGVSEMFVKGNDKLVKSAGSPAFMAPELCIARHGEVSGKAADIWSMGVTLYCLVFGHLPYSSSNIIELMDKIRDDPVDYSGNQNISVDLLDILQRLLDKDPSTRITMHELRQHPWVTQHGTDMLISEEENCEMVVTEVTDDDIHNAIKSIASILTVVKAVAKFKRHSRSLSQQSLSKLSASISPDQDQTMLVNATSALDIQSNV
ncbi:kinase-like domain-containing protein [Halteromyces radiatus]|uniref:kinase-like domain-containing protein n=1 Tax=Halteromyces radiatus TaxID=101107 RepID=UPI00221E6C80|nr:kinase-like domain-containing protein [Halteromyces radiatus]KAI8092476.1 kinase-like domain-containing protein [Halteromyces radiatus]